jgi:hypothetical protein
VWKINPTISTNVDSCKDYFKGAGILEIPAKGSAEYEVAYTPLTMTKEKKEDESDENSAVITIFHEASLFFPLPDGSAALHNLFGKSQPPESNGAIEADSTAKLQKYISIPIESD